MPTKGKYIIPKEVHDRKRVELIKRIKEESMTNEEKLQELEDILHRKLEGEFKFDLLKKRLELLLLIAQIKKANR